MAKRFLDLSIAILGISFFLIPMFFISICIILNSRGPILHWSLRIGLNNQKFLMPKFRTMVKNTPQLSTDKINNPSKYITSVGNFLRKTSLDELPQLFSIFVGDMAVVGPRPALFNQYNLIELRTKKNIQTLKPGLTGWAQINGRDQIEDLDKVNLDFYYKENKNIFLDLKIIFLTFKNVFIFKNVSH